MTSLRSLAASVSTSFNRSRTCLRFSALIGVPSAIRSVKITKDRGRRKAQLLEPQYRRLRSLAFFELAPQLAHQIVEMKGLGEDRDVAELLVAALRIRHTRDDDGWNVAERLMPSP